MFSLPQLPVSISGIAGLPNISLPALPFADILAKIPPASCLVVVPLYFGAVYSQRWKRYNAIHAKYQEKYERGTLTPEEAQEIVHVSTFYDMPMLLNYALAFALFKTFASPSVSGLLWATKELGTSERVSKRYADTELMVSTYIAFPISGFFGASGPPCPGAEADPRAMIALARTNWLHSKYNISNEDYLYTLALFLLEPATWAQKYGWRALSPMEEEAFFIFWREIGIRMNIRDIPETLEEIKSFSRTYEQAHIRPAETNRDIASCTIEELIFIVPEAFGIKRFARRIVNCLVEDNFREAMMLPGQPWYIHLIAGNSVTLLHQVQKWFCFPRSRGKAPIDLEPQVFTPGVCPRLRPAKYQVKPWYKAEGKSYLGKLADKFMVFAGAHSELPSPEFMSSGYRLEEMGPLQFTNKGHEEVMKMAAELQNYPVTGPWSLNWAESKQNRDEATSV